MHKNRDKNDTKTIEHIERLANLARVVFGGTYAESLPCPQQPAGERRIGFRP